MKMQTNEAHHASANKWSTLCKCRYMKHIKPMQKKEIQYEIAKIWIKNATENN